MKQEELRTIVESHASMAAASNDGPLELLSTDVRQKAKGAVTILQYGAAGSATLAVANRDGSDKLVFLDFSGGPEKLKLRISGPDGGSADWIDLDDTHSDDPPMTMGTDQNCVDECKKTCPSDPLGYAACLAGCYAGCTT